MFFSRLNIEPAYNRASFDHLHPGVSAEIKMKTKIIGNMGVAMGNYFFTPAEGGDVVKVEYSFGYTVNTEGQLKIVLHDSHLPYSPA